MAADGGRLASFNDLYLVVRSADGGVFAFDGSLRLLPRGLYAALQKIVLSRTYYAVILSTNKPKEQWIAEPAGGGAYFFSQRVDGRPVYLSISEGVLSGDPAHKTALRLEAA
ncbi:hypothetical protein EBZ80_02150 [bacterium]|nr:hypothetical protein [bacterium]